ncbi:hypothetical protein B0T24DRAFT_528789 [Lasiosphaeria ovina]|uniref:ARCA protein n=1 Tax=Lasiosphaeria ovina TaxID=92902 RepID=A0AAE0N736_9PEZI|nr:hypothetical protein B0T24DRAFT_528789 [Lasiosphaeria ovina]
MQIDHVISPSSSIVSPASPTDRFFRRVPKSDSDEDEILAVEPVQDNAAATPDDENQQTVDNSVLPFSDGLEARLFMHFVQKLATWLDLCDPAQSFERIVPARAQSGNCPILLNAILALSARHMSHISNCDYPQSLALQYSQKCFDDLNRILDQPGAILDENLFAAAIILRVLEEMDVKDTGRDLRTHLIGIKRFVEARVESLVPGFVPGSLSAASFWVGLRQEIYSAVMTSQAVHISLLHSLVDRSLKQADDYTWANRAVVHCADVLNFCFGEKSEVGAKRRTEEWVELNRRSKQWIDGLPPSFRPIFDGKGNGAFPHICYWRSCHVIGMQHHLLAELFLVHYDPRPLVNEPDRQLAVSQELTHGSQRRAEWLTGQLQNHIQELVRRVCGIGLSNEWTPPSMFTACMVIAAFGDLFHDRQDQEAMIEILKKTEKDHLRPTEEVQKKMRVTWGWPQHNR